MTLHTAKSIWRSVEKLTSSLWQKPGPAVPGKIDEKLGEQTRTFQELNDKLSQRNKTLSERNKTLKERYEALKERIESLKQREVNFSQRNMTLSERYATLKERYGTLKERIEVLKQREEKFSQRNKTLTERYEILKGRYEALKERNEEIKRRDDVINGRYTALKDRYEALKEKSKTLKEGSEALKKRSSVQVDGNEGLKKALQAAKDANKYYAASRRFSPLYRQGLLADNARVLGNSVAADSYISLLPSTLPAAFEFQRNFGGRVFCDHVENVDVHNHSIAPNWDPIALQMTNDVGRGSMADCHGLLTIGDALARTLQQFSRPIFVLKNFREFSEPKADGRLRENLGIPHDSLVLFASGNVVVGFEPVIEALSKLPSHYHLLALIRLKPAVYEEEMLQKVAELNLQDRVHIRPFVEYEELAVLASGADVGLITSDISNPNGAVGLPNRCFDYLTSGLPVVAPAMPDVKALVAEHGFGEILTETTAEQWQSCIQRVVDDLDNYRLRAQAARRILTWESQDEGVFEFLGRPKTITMFGFRDLSRYQRYRRLARTLRRFGCAVNMVFFSEDPDNKNLVEGVSYYFCGDRYGVGPGFRALTAPAEDMN